MGLRCRLLWLSSALAAALALSCGGTTPKPPPAPTGLSYSNTSAAYPIGSAITDNVPTITGTVDTWAVTPRLPAGLVLDSSSGVIFGTPSAVAAEATYVVAAANGGGSVTTSLRLGVVAPAGPAIVTQPASQVVALDQSATFTVVASGTGPLTYQWSRDGSALAGSASASLTTLPATYLDDGSLFEVQVTDCCGSTVVSRVARLRLEGFLPGNPMTSARLNHAASKFGAAGKVLVSGGFWKGVLSSVEVYDPATGTFSATGALIGARQNHTSSALADGRVLVVGGQSGTGGGVPTATAEVYDPLRGQFSGTRVMASPRVFHTATVLKSGHVLVTGGRWAASGPAVLEAAEVYDPATGVFEPAGAMSEARYWHTAALLANGTVLISGGYGLTGAPLGTAEVYDPATAQFTRVGSLGAPRYGHTATVLADGTVLVVGGYGAGLLGDAELFDPVTGQFSSVGALQTARQFHTATLLPGGQVFIAGGLTLGEALDSAERYDPVLGTFVREASMEEERSNHTATLLDSGEVMVTGGWSLIQSSLDSTELFSGLP